MEEGAAAVVGGAAQVGVIIICGLEVVVCGGSGEVEAGEEGAEGRVAVDEGGDMGGSGFDQSAE